MVDFRGNAAQISARRVHRSAAMPPIAAAWHLMPVGERPAAPVAGDAIHLARPLHEWEVVVVSTDPF